MAIFSGKATKDTIHGTPGADNIYGNGGNDRLSGGGGDDLIDGGAHEDTLSGGDGIDHLFGGSGRDFLTGGAGDDLLDGGTGDDYLWDLLGSNAMIGGSGNDRVVTNQFGVSEGSDGNDTMVLVVEGDSRPGNARFDGGTGTNGLSVNLDKATWEFGDVDYAYMEVESIGANGLNGSMGLQSDIENEDAWARSDSGHFQNIKSFSVTNDTQLYFEGRGGKGTEAAQDITITGGSGADFIQLGRDNETIYTGDGKDFVYATGFSTNDSGPVSWGRDHIAGFDADEDLLLLGWGEEGSRVDVQETSSQTIITAFLTDAFGADVPVDHITVDAVGINIQMEWMPI